VSYEKRKSIWGRGKRAILIRIIFIREKNQERDFLIKIIKRARGEVKKERGRVGREAESRFLQPRVGMGKGTRCILKVPARPNKRASANGVLSLSTIKTFSNAANWERTKLTTY